MRRLAIDPGDKHVGWCYGVDATACETGEWTPTEACTQITYFFTNNLVDEIIIEEYVLYQQEYANQAWSSMQTSQLIGAIKLIASWFRIPVEEQGAYIKKPTRRQLAARGIRQLKGSIHAHDAELHFYYRALRAKKEQDGKAGST